LGEAVGPESFPSRARERPREPDTDNTGVGNGKGDRILSGMRFFVFLVSIKP